MHLGEECSLVFTLMGGLDSALQESRRDVSLCAFHLIKTPLGEEGEMCGERCVTKTVSSYFFHINKGIAHVSERRASMLSGCSINERAHCALKA